MIASPHGCICSETKKDDGRCEEGEGMAVDMHALFKMLGEEMRENAGNE